MYIIYTCIFSHIQDEYRSILKASYCMVFSMQYFIYYTKLHLLKMLVINKVP